MIESYARLQAEAAGLQDWLTAIRRHIHRYPECGVDQPETAAFVAKKLREMGLEPDTSKVGCVCDITGEQPGPKRGFRADMDALELAESKDPDYPSVAEGFRSIHEGRMHACGHDFHCAILLGLARLLVQHRSELKGTVRLLFQPGEEGFGGAKRMIDAGSLTGLERVYALHVWPKLPVGAIAFRPGVFFASISKLFVTVTGKGGHGAMPHLATDQVLIGSKMICDLQSIVSRRLDPLDPAVVSICYIHAGEPSADNVIPARLEFRGTVRTLSDATRLKIGEEIVRILENRARMEGDDVKVDVKYYRLYRETINSPEVCREVQPLLESVLGRENVDPDFPITMGAEDFSEMLSVVPGMMFWLGAGVSEAENQNPESKIQNMETPVSEAWRSHNASERHSETICAIQNPKLTRRVILSGAKDLIQNPLDDVPMLHHPAVQLDESCLPVGVRLFAALALR